MAKRELQRRPKFPALYDVEIPNNVFLLDEFIDVGIDGVSIGSNDLTMLTLVAIAIMRLWLKSMMSVTQGFKKLLKLLCVPANDGDCCSICGQAPSIYPENH